MSVLINMEMPTRCGECKAFVCYRQWAGDSGDCFCGITKSDAKVGAQNADCPLVPVPPHGRLGDLDALAESVTTPGIFSPVVSSEVLAFLRNAPTIIPAELPVLHGTFAATSEQEALKRIAPAEEGE